MKVFENNAAAQDILRRAEADLQALMHCKVKLQMQIEMQLDVIGLERFVSDASKLLGVLPAQVLSKSRDRDIVEARHITCHFLFKKSSFTQVQLAEYFGFSDHSSVSNCSKTVVDLLTGLNDVMTTKFLKVFELLKSYEREFTEGPAGN